TYKADILRVSRRLFGLVIARGSSGSAACRSPAPPGSPPAGERRAALRRRQDRRPRNDTQIPELQVQTEHRYRGVPNDVPRPVGRGPTHRGGNTRGDPNPPLGGHTVIAPGALNVGPVEPSVVDGPLGDSRDSV